MDYVNQIKNMTVKELRNLLDTYPDDETFLLFTINFDKNENVSNIGELVSKELIGIIAQKSQSIIYTKSKHLINVDIHSVKQLDICNIQPKGVMKTVLFDNVKG